MQSFACLCSFVVFLNPFNTDVAATLYRITFVSDCVSDVSDVHVSDRLRNQHPRLLATSVSTPRLCGYLPIDTMIRFEHGPIMWSGLTRANAAILLTGEKRSLQQDGASFKKLAPCENSVFCYHEFPLLSRHVICSNVGT